MYSSERPIRASSLELVAAAGAVSSWAVGAAMKIQREHDHREHDHEPIAAIVGELLDEDHPDARRAEAHRRLTSTSSSISER
jgi:hypothetical protein